MVTGLVLCCILRSRGRSLLQEAMNSYRSWKGRLVEEGDNIKSFVLGGASLAYFILAMQEILTIDAYKAEHLE